MELLFITINVIDLLYHSYIRTLSEYNLWLYILRALVETNQYYSNSDINNKVDELESLPEVNNVDKVSVSQTEECLLNEISDSDSSSESSDSSEDSSHELEVEGNIENCESESSDSDLILNEDESPSTDNHLDLEVAGSSHVEDIICSRDLGEVIKLKSERQLTDQEKYMLLKIPFVPASNYRFPPRIFNGYTRHFQHAWLKSYNGLVYSVSEDGGFCKYCVLFGKSSPGKQQGVLVSVPLINFKRACEKLTKHFHSGRTGLQYHRAAVLEAKEFIRVMEDKSKGIKEQVDMQRSKRIEENISELVPIAQTVIFCGKQGIALRGHSDDSLAIEEDPKANHGNFYALLKFRILSGDVILKEHLKTASKNALYTSKTVQNDMIAVCGDIIRNKILALVYQAGVYSVIADEATDRSNREQLSITIRFVNDNKPVEKFLGFQECTSGISGEALADNILEQLKAWQLHPQYMRGQAYDGAGAMAGKTKGVAARINTLYPKALYTHCAAHRLNLCVVKCCGIIEVNNVMHIAESIS